MNNAVQLILILIIALAFMLVLVMKFKMNAALALLFASILMGVGAGLSLNDLVTGLGDGFGNFMNSTGLPIGLGIILGQILYDYGGAHSIATSLINSFPKSKVFYALALAAFIISIPVFFDVTFILLAPLGIAMAEEIKAPRYKVCIALLAGAVLTHACVPPTPGPLSIAGIMGADVGLMIVAGSILGVIALIITMKIVDVIFKGNFWKPETDEIGSEGNQEADRPLLANDKKAPGPFISAIPILVPIVALLTNTIWSIVAGDVPTVIVFLGNKTISMLLGVIAALIIGKTRLDWNQISSSCNNSLSSSGVVLFITGAGAAFGQILSLCGIAAVITEGISNLHANGVVMVIMAYVIALILRIAQGSTTVACVTSATIIAETVSTLGYNPLFISLAACAGAIAVSHVNDSGFWIIVSRFGFTVKGGFKCVTLVTTLISVILLVECIICGAIF